MTPTGRDGVKVDRYLAWPIDSQYAEICMYWYDDDRWSRGCDDTIKITHWMPIPERSNAFKGGD